MITLAFFFALSIGFSFLCSILEAVLLSVTPGFIKKEKREGSKTGILLDKYKEDIDRPLSAILTLNTIAHTVGAIGVGAMAGDLFGENYFSLGPISLSYESLVATFMTLAILILSEIIPKTIGANNWKELSGFTVRTLQVLLFILAPLVWVSQLITRKLKKEKEKSVLTRSDIFQLAEEGESSGALKQTESKIIKNLLQFEKKVVGDIMTPRSVAFMMQEESKVSDFVALEDSNTYSRIPVFGKDKDEVTGFVLKDAIMRASAEDKHDTPLSAYRLTIGVVTKDTTLPQLFNKLTESRKHVFIVKDEFGHILGLVTMEDLFEELLGQEIMDESDKVEDLQKLARDNNAQES